MDTELSQAILAVDAEMMGNQKYRYWAYIVDKVKTMSVSSNSVWGIVADSEEENEALKNENEQLKNKVQELQNEVARLNEKLAEYQPPTA